VEIERRILAALPWVARPAGARLIRLAARSIPLRGIAKDAYLQATDVIRASARRIGGLLAESGLLDAPDDVFFLTDTEIRGLADGTFPADSRALVARRRERYEHYKELDLPNTWVGDPTPVPAADDPRDDEHSNTLTGVGVSPGVVEGSARVITDPSFDDVEPGEILVAPSTDPSWASIMFLSSALVVDIGGALSHAAIVARELGVPCVVNTVTGTRVIRTGDHIRVDGAGGVVTIMKRGES
jgi:pyruvate,water dikinase